MGLVQFNSIQMNLVTEGTAEHFATVYSTLLTTLKSVMREMEQVIVETKQLRKPERTVKTGQP